jgi:TonB family protein
LFFLLVFLAFSGVNDLSGATVAISSGNALLSCGGTNHDLPFREIDDSRETSSRQGKESTVVSGNDIVPPKLIKTVAPIYPKRALSWGIEGIVIVEATTDIEGRVVATKVLKSVPALDKAAVNAIKKWVFEPFIIEDRPRPIVFTVTLKFSVSGDTDIKDTQPPKLIRQVDPVYPEEAKKQNIEGTVILGITIGLHGLVTEVKVLESVPALDQAAIDAVKQWQYSGAWIGGQPVIYSTTVTMKFSLNSSKKRP